MKDTLCWDGNTALPLPGFFRQDIELIPDIILGMPGHELGPCESGAQVLWRRAVLDLIQARGDLRFLISTMDIAALTRELAAWPRRAGLTAIPKNIVVALSVPSQNYFDQSIAGLYSLPVKAECKALLVTPNALIDISAPFCPRCGASDCQTVKGAPMCSTCRVAVEHPVAVGAYMWVIARGRGRAPMQPRWARHLRDQARAAGVRFSLDWGGWVPLSQAGGGQPIFWEDLTPAQRASALECSEGKVTFLRTEDYRHRLDGIDYDERPED